MQEEDKMKEGWADSGSRGPRKKLVDSQATEEVNHQGL